MVLKATPLIESPKVASLDFQPDLTQNDMVSRVDLTPDGAAFMFGKTLPSGAEVPFSRHEKDGHHLECAFVCPFVATCPFTGMADMTYPTADKCLKDCDWLSVEVEARHYQSKENITFKVKPSINVFTLMVDTDLAPVISEDGLTVEWQDLNSATVYRWEPVRCVDTSGVVFYGKYLPALSGNDVRIEISQADIDNAVYPVVVDPTTTVISTSALFTGNFNVAGDSQFSAWNGEAMLHVLPTGSGGAGVTLYGSNPAALTDETTTNPMVAADYYHIFQAIFSDGEHFIMFAQYGTGGAVYTMTRAKGAGGAYSTPVQITYSTYNFRAAHKTLDCCIDENDRVWVFEREVLGRYMWYSDDRGATWTRVSTICPWSIHGNASGDHGLAYSVLPSSLAGGGNTKIVFLFAWDSTAYELHYGEFDTVTLTWNTSVKINGATYDYNNAGCRMKRLVVDNNGKISAVVQDRVTSYNILISNATGSWVETKFAGGAPSWDYWYGSSMQLTDNDEVMAGARVNGATWGRNVFTSPIDNDVLGSFNYYGTYQSVIIAFGEPAWWITTDGTNIVFVEDDEYTKQVIADTNPPTITARNPDNLDTGVALNSNIYFELDDSGDGVDSSTITVTVEGGNAILNGVFQSGYSGTIVADGAGGFDVTINPDTDFVYNQVVNVTVDCDDLAANSMTQDVYSFTIKADNDPPTNTGHSPGKSSTGISPGTNIYFELDDLTQVDNTTINVTIEGANAIVNGVFQTGFDGANSAIVADGTGYNVTIDPTAAFAFGQVVNVTVDCDDSLGNSMVQDVYSFTIVAQLAASNTGAVSFSNFGR